MVGFVGGQQPPLPSTDDLGPIGPPSGDELARRLREQLDRSHRHLMELRVRAAEERHVRLALRDAILPDPGGAIELPGSRVTVRYVPAEQSTRLGGDWYEAATLPDGRVLLAVGDVSGHGLPSIAHMAQLRHALVGLAMTGERTDRLLAWLNDLVLHRLEDTTATAVVGHLDPGNGEFTWSQAGHPAPILVRGGSARQLRPPCGTVLGASGEWPYGVARLTLRTDDLLLLFTDGLVERRHRDIDEGVSLALATARGIRRDDLDAGLDHLIESIGGPNPDDDTCVLAVRVLRR
jgi:serine phosphatase RsbU (regulator of sigma subunit)